MTTQVSLAPVEALTVDRMPLSDLTTQFQRYQKPGIPVVITGLLKPEWDWNLAYLCEQLGDRTFLLRYYGKDRYRQDKRTWKTIGSGVQVHSKPFTEYADLLRSRVAHQQDIYLAKCSLQETPLVNTEAIQTATAECARLGLQQPATNWNLWIVPGGHSDYQAFPKLRQAMQYKYEITLNPGEGLYIPAGWWQ